MHRLIADHGLPPVQFHAVICGYEVDFWIIDSPVVLECDGWETHGRNRVQFEHDRVRDAELAAGGYITLRFTYGQLMCHGRAQAERIRTVVRRWAPHLLGGSRPGSRDGSRPDTNPAQMGEVGRSR